MLRESERRWKCSCDPTQTVLISLHLVQTVLMFLCIKLTKNIGLCKIFKSRLLLSTDLWNKILKPTVKTSCSSLLTSVYTVSFSSNVCVCVRARTSLCFSSHVYFKCICVCTSSCLSSNVWFKCVCVGALETVINWFHVGLHCMTLPSKLSYSFKNFSSCTYNYVSVHLRICMLPSAL